MEIPCDGELEGSLGAVNRNRKKVDFNGNPTVIGEVVSVNFLRGNSLDPIEIPHVHANCIWVCTLSLEPVL